MTDINFLYNRAATLKHFGKNHFVDKNLDMTIIECGTVLPHKHLYVNEHWTWGVGGLVDGRGEFVKSSFVRNGTGGAYIPTEIHHSPETVVYLGMFFPVWGHYLTDNIRRLWFLQSDAFKKYFKDCPLVCVLWGGAEIDRQKNFRRLLELLHVDVDKLQAVVEPTQFENVILPDESFFVEGDDIFFTEKYCETIDRVRDFALKNRTPTAKKIFLFHGANQTGEDRLADYFHAKGYEIVSPEKLPLDEQLNVLINTQIFASTLGSCSHNAIFLRDGTDVILIPRAVNNLSEPLGYQEAINQIRGLNATYIDSTLSVFEAFREPHCYILSRQLKEFFGDTFDGYGDDDFENFLEYFRYCNDRKFDFSPDAESYYGAVFREFLLQLKARPDLTADYGVKLN